MAPNKTGKIPTTSGTRGTSSVTQSRPTRTQSSTPSTPDRDTSQSDAVKSSEQAREWLEANNLLVPLEAELTLPMLSTTLFHIAELSKMPALIAQAIRSVAWLIGELEEETVAESTRTAVNEQLDFLNTETKTLIDEIRTTLSEEVEKQVNLIGTAATKALEERTNRPTSYRDALISNVALPHGTDPRILAREGIRLRQFIIDVPADTPLRNMDQAEILKRFNGAMDNIAGDLGENARKIRSVVKLSNKGLLGEFMHDEGAKWFAKQNHADAFVTALGVDCTGASVKKRNHPMIAYYVPLNLNTENPTHLAEITESNNLQPGDLVKVRWAKPPARRSPSQICGHLILTFSNPDAANRAKTEGLIICSKRVSVAKYKKEPIRCLKCQGWNHVAAECVQTDDRCGTCGATGHRTSACTSNTPFCVNCDLEGHTSWSRECPTFARKCREFDLKHPENTLPYYPSSEPWTWASEPQPPDITHTPNPAPPPPIRNRPATQKLRQLELNFGTRSNAIPVSSQGSARQWGSPAPQTGPQRTSPPISDPELSNEHSNFPGDPPTGTDAWYTE